MFRSPEQVSAFVRVYQGGKNPLVDVPLRIQVRNDDNVTVLDRREVIASSTVGAVRASDVNLELPIGRLMPGEYLLTIEAAVPQKPGVVKREVRFTIQ
jgi:hypothetical protein